MQAGESKGERDKGLYLVETQRKKPNQVPQTGTIATIYRKSKEAKRIQIRRKSESGRDDSVLPTIIHYTKITKQLVKRSES